MRNRVLLAVTFGLVICAAGLQAQPTITSVTNESGESFLCPGGVAFVRGTALGTSKNIAVTVGGKAAFVISVGGGGSTQVQLPTNAAQGAATLTVGNSAPFNITLGQFCPGIPSGKINNVSYVFALHDSSGLQVTPSFPAIPGELVDILVTGLGPTTPPYATGTSPNDSSAATNTTPTVSIGGQQAKAVNAYLAPNSPGFYFVVARTASSLKSGDQSVTVSIGGLTSNATAFLPLTTGGAVSSVTNAATYLDTSLPNGGVAQGAIAVAKGKNLGPQDLTVDPKPFQNTTTGGTSVAITVGGTTVAGLMYYTSFNQIAFLVPSNTPAGTGTVTVTYNGQAGAAAPITIVPSNLGVFTISSDGQGEAIVTYPDYSLVSPWMAANCGGPNTTCGAANPNDTLILWATGLGPVNGTDASGAGLGQNMPDVPLKLWIGGVQANVSYQGRSGCCIAEDQIVFTVPPNVPTGCAVPLVAQINDQVSNTTVLPIAALGNRTCTPASGFGSANVQTLSSVSSFNVGALELDHFLNDNGSGFFDQAKFDFITVSGIPAGVQPFAASYIDSQPLGTCTVFTGQQPPSDRFFSSLNFVPLDGGSKFTVQGPKGTMTVTAQTGDRPQLSATGAFLVPGNYTITGTGGKDAGPFTANVTLPATPSLISPANANNLTVTRSAGLPVSWNANGSTGQVEMVLISNTSGGLATTAVCTAPANAGAFTIPPYVLQALPAGTTTSFSFQPGDQTPASASTFTATGLTVGLLQTFVDEVRFGGFTIH